MLLRVSSSGAADRIHIYDWTRPFEEIFWVYVPMITNADQGVLLTWETETSYLMATVTGASVQIASAPTIPGQDDVIVPVLQAQDGSFVGSTWACCDTEGDDVPYMVAFGQNGGVRWTAAND